MNTLAEKIKIINFNRDMPELDPGSNTIQLLMVSILKE